MAGALARPAASTLTPGELRLMQILWSDGPSSASQVAAALPKLSKNAVFTTLSILERKGQITHEVVGRTFIYRALTDERSARKRVLDDIAARFFGGSKGALLLQLIEDEAISEADAARIEDALIEAQGRRESR
jgi:BlaI family transcriptional regulator, penicillinase repressor